MSALKQWLQDIDNEFFLFINKSWQNAFFDSFMPWMTDLHRSTLFWIVCAVGFGLLIYRLKKHAVTAILFLLFAITISDIFCYRVVKPFVHRLRPSHIASLQATVRVPFKGGDLGFPSNHAANSFAFATGVAMLFPALATPAFIIAALIAYSRVYVGVHFPLDVLVGGLIGYVIARTLWGLLEILGKFVPQIRLRSHKLKN